MSTNDPGQPEYLGSGPAGEPVDGSARPSRRRTGVIIAVVVAVVAAVGAGAYGVGQFMSKGGSPASAVPADAIGYASVDLDPSAAQKIEAIKILRKFPGLRSELKIGSRDDLRRSIFEQIVEDGDCTGVDYDSDVKPWIGNRLAVAAMPEAKAGVIPLVVLQVTDEKKAEQGVRKLEKCDSSGGPAGIAFVDDYLLLTEKQADADRLATAAGSATLADDSQFQAWMDRTGDPGIITMYASKDAPSAIAAAEKAKASGASTAPRGADQLEKAFTDFEGAAGVVRFKDGAVEAEFTTKGLGKGVGSTSASGPDITTLPDTTAAVLSVALRDGWLDSTLDSMKDSGGSASLDDVLPQLEQATGLQLPEDLQTLLGDGFDVSVDSSADLRALAESPDPTTVPAGIRIKGDTEKITAVIDKLRAKVGPTSDLVQVRSKDGVVAVGTDKAYVDSLLEKGDLGSSEAFTTVVPEAGRANGVLFVNFDAGNGWAERLADLVSGGDQEVKDNVKPLDALGLSSWQDTDQVQHSLLRLTTD